MPDKGDRAEVGQDGVRQRSSTDPCDKRMYNEVYITLSWFKDSEKIPMFEKCHIIAIYRIFLDKKEKREHKMG